MLIIPAGTAVMTLSRNNEIMRNILPARIYDGSIMFEHYFEEIDLHPKTQMHVATGVLPLLVFEMKD